MVFICCVWLTLDFRVDAITFVDELASSSMLATHIFIAMVLQAQTLCRCLCIERRYLFSVRFVRDKDWATADFAVLNIFLLRYAQIQQHRNRLPTVGTRKCILGFHDSLQLRPNLSRRSTYVRCSLECAVAFRYADKDYGRVALSGFIFSKTESNSYADSDT